MKTFTIRFPKLQENKKNSCQQFNFFDKLQHSQIRKLAWFRNKLRKDGYFLITKRGTIKGFERKCYEEI